MRRTRDIKSTVKNSSPLRHQVQNVKVDGWRDVVREAFTLFDLNRDGYMDYHECKAALQALGFEKTKQEMLVLLRDNGDNNRISYDGFYEVTTAMKSEQDPVDEIRRAFRLFDIDNKGRISLQDLRRVVKDLGDDLTVEEMRAMIDMCSFSESGYVTEAEFIKIFDDWHG
ncbi:cell division control protein 31 [Diutina catenulata]